jgi:hypothetical protein
MSTELSSSDATTELDIYAAEFAKLVDRHTPSRRDAPAGWLRRLPDEALQYYWKGIATFGSAAQTPIERRGRLYLIHTTLLFMWMSWGKSTARERFQARPDEGTRRTASLVTLEHYRRGGVLADYEVDDWFSAPVDEWAVTLISGAVDDASVPDASRRAALRQETTVRLDVGTLAQLRAAGAIPAPSALSLG